MKETFSICGYTRISVDLEDKGPLVRCDLGWDGKGVLDILLGKDGNPCSDTAYERQRYSAAGRRGLIGL